MLSNSAGIFEVLGILASIAGLVISIFSYWIGKRSSKKLSYSILMQQPLLVLPEDLKDDLQVFYNQTPLRDAHLVLIELKNSGTTPILPNDYLTPLTVNFGDSAKIISTEVISQSPHLGNVKITPEQSRVMLTPSPLNPNDSLTLRLIVGNFSGNTVLEGRLTGVSRIEEQAIQ